MVKWPSAKIKKKKKYHVIKFTLDFLKKLIRIFVF